MAVTITATKYFTGTGPIKFSEIRDTFGDLPGSNVRLSDYKRNSTADIDWYEDNTISQRVPDATENTGCDSCHACDPTCTQALLSFL